MPWKFISGRIFLFFPLFLTVIHLRSRMSSKTIRKQKQCSWNRDLQWSLTFIYYNVLECQAFLDPCWGISRWRTVSSKSLPPRGEEDGVWCGHLLFLKWHKKFNNLFQDINRIYWGRDIKYQNREFLNDVYTELGNISFYEFMYVTYWCWIT